MSSVDCVAALGFCQPDLALCFVLYPALHLPGCGLAPPLQKCVYVLAHPALSRPAPPPPSIPLPTSPRPPRSGSSSPKLCLCDCPALPSPPSIPGTYANLVKQAKSKQKILDKMYEAGLTQPVAREQTFQFNFPGRFEGEGPGFGVEGLHGLGLRVGGQGLQAAVMGVERGWHESRRSSSTSQVGWGLPYPTLCRGVGREGQGLQAGAMGVLSVGGTGADVPVQLPR